jgi:hypothetical protein
MRDGHAYWPVICGCHAQKWVRGSKLQDGSTVSCGCERADSDMRRLARSGPGPQDYLDDEMDAHESFREVDEPPESELEAAALGIWAPEAHREIRSRRAEEELEEAEERRRARE